MKYRFYILFALAIILICTFFIRMTSPMQNKPTYNDNTDSDDAVFPTSLRISEVMPANKSYICDSLGEFSDWIELENYGTETLDLSHFYISDNPQKPYKFHIPDINLKAGDRYVLFASGRDCMENGELHTNFKLSKDGETIVIYDINGNLCDTFSFGKVMQNFSVTHDGTTPYATPLFENTDEGYMNFCKNKTHSDIIINEIMPQNVSAYEVNGSFPDWCELKNASSKSVSLDGLYLSDDVQNLKKYSLTGSIPSGGLYMAVDCLSIGKNDTVILSDGDKILDSITMYDVPTNASFGRYDGGLFYFASPTPNAENKNGIAMRSITPQPDSDMGIYPDISSLDVSLSGEGTIYYTTDGSEPTTNSSVYTKPITITNSGVIRAFCHMDGKIDSEKVTYNYLLNEKTKLPVIALSTANENMFDDETGIYVKGNHNNYYQDWEVPCNFTYFDENGSVSADCGLKMFGSGSREDCEKKSLRINFKKKYGTGKINYDFFGNGVDEFNSLVIRAGEDYLNSIFRNELFTSAASEAMPTLLTQSSKYCIVYLNGEYFGIFCLMEHFSQEYFASHYNVSKDSVSIEEAPVNYERGMGQIFTYINTHDMSDTDNYNYVCDHVDIDSFIDWLIMQTYSRNSDVVGNIRYFYSTETGKWQMALYDLDWAFYHYETPCFSRLERDRQYPEFFNGMKHNVAFRDRFLQRMKIHLDGVLSNESMLSRIDKYHDMLAPESDRNRAKWTGAYASWEHCVQKLRDFITSQDIRQQMIDGAKIYMNCTDGEIAKYFG